jgi:hypothetical protein
MTAPALGAETTYWLPTVKREPTQTVVTYTVKVPDFFVPWILEKNERGGGDEVQKTAGGRAHTFVRQGFSWDDTGSSPARTGQIRIDNKKERHTSDAWKHEPRLSADAAFVRALAAASEPTTGAWRQADLLFLKWSSDGNPNVTLTEPVSALD